MPHPSVTLSAGFACAPDVICEGSSSGQSAAPQRVRQLFEAVFKQITHNANLASCGLGGQATEQCTLQGRVFRARETYSDRAI